MILAREFLVHAVEETNLASANTDVTSGYILIRADATPELEHKGLTETHDFCIGFTHRIKIRTAFCATHRERRQRVFKGLLETEELQHRRSHSSMKTQTAFVRTDGAIELHAVTEVGLHFALIINPCHAEGEDTIRLDHALHDLRSLKLGVLVIHLFNRLEHLLYGLQVLCLTRMFRSQTLHNVLYFHCFCVF